MNRGNQITKQEEQHRGLNEEEQTQTQREKIHERTGDPRKLKDEKNQRREEKPRDPKQATVFDFAPCTGKFFISLSFAIIIAWVLYIGQFNSLLTGLCMHV
jgi:hypothetical protein